MNQSEISEFNLSGPVWCVHVQLNFHCNQGIQYQVGRRWSCCDPKVNIKKITLQSQISEYESFNQRFKLYGAGMNPILAWKAVRIVTFKKYLKGRKKHIVWSKCPNIPFDNTTYLLHKASCFSCQIATRSAIHTVKL